MQSKHKYACIDCAAEFSDDESKQWHTDCGHRVELTQHVIDVTPPPLVKLRNLGARFENRKIKTDVFVSVVDELRSITLLATYECPNCSAQETVEGNGFFNPAIPKCEHCKVNCKLISKDSTTNLRIVLVEELPDEVEYKYPVHFFARVTGDLVNSLETGTKVRLTATYHSVVEPKKQDNQVVLLVEGIEPIDVTSDIGLTKDEEEALKSKANEDPERYWSTLIKSIAPAVKRNTEIKESIALTIARGSHVFPEVTRDYSNLFLVSNPGRGKTELLKFAAQLACGTYVMGVSSTKAGLGAGMVKLPNGTSVPRAGPFITYSGKTVVYDEFDKAGSEDKKSTLEVAENGTVTKTVAGVDRQYTAETSIIAAANPKFGEWDDDASLLENINLEPFYLTRFALIWKIEDPDDQLSQEISQSVLGLRKEEDSNPIPLDTLKRIFNHCRKLEPGISLEGRQKLNDFYQRMSKPDPTKKTLPMETRQLKDMIRFVTARAKLLFKDEADITDVDAVLRIYEAAFNKLNLTTKGEVRQMKLIDKELEREQRLQKIIKECQDESGKLDEEQLCHRLSQEGLFRTFESAVKWFNSKIGSCFFLEGSRYKYKPVSY